MADDDVRAVLRDGPATCLHRRDSHEAGRLAGRRGARSSCCAPLLSRRGRTAGVVEMTVDPEALDSSVTASSRTVWVAVAIVFALLWLALVLLVRGASARLTTAERRVPRADLRSCSSRRSRLEESLLETVETLNAAVEARDPYTAGHSQRVRRVALAIGRELGLSTKQLGALGTAALFHDVGKIGIPDSILTKPGPLEPAEAAIMREHVTRGAEIVSKVSSFQDSVPAVRHHHERWDGLGYPDGLSGDEIPLEATIIGLADAWDAMTTDRPYAAALSLNDALLQIRSGRGKQFNPAGRGCVHGRREAAHRRGAPAAGARGDDCGELTRRASASGRRPSEGEVRVHHLALELPRRRIPREEDRVSPLEPLAGRLVLEPATFVRRGDAGLLADSLRPDDDVVEVEVDVRERRQQLGVEASGALVALPAGSRPDDLVDAVLGRASRSARAGRGCPRRSSGSSTARGSPCTRPSRPAAAGARECARSPRSAPYATPRAHGARRGRERPVRLGWKGGS